MVVAVLVGAIDSEIVKQNFHAVLKSVFYLFSTIDSIRKYKKMNFVRFRDSSRKKLVSKRLLFVSAKFEFQDGFSNEAGFVSKPVPEEGQTSRVFDSQHQGPLGRLELRRKEAGVRLLRQDGLRLQLGQRPPEQGTHLPGPL